MKFSHNYAKLSLDKFSTIRRMPYWAIDDEVLVKTPKGNFEAKVTDANVRRFGHLNPQFVRLDVWLDTQARMPSYDQAIDFINKLLGITVKNHTIFVVYYLEKIGKGAS